MIDRLEEIVQLFKEADPEMRLELLLDFSDRLPALPEELCAERDAGFHRVPECQSPVYLRIEIDSGNLRFYADVPSEAPTVRGFVNILREAVHGAPAASVAEIPLDLLSRMGVAPLLGMMRSQGLNAILSRVRARARQAMEAA